MGGGEFGGLCFAEGDEGSCEGCFCHLVQVSFYIRPSRIELFEVNWG